MKKFLVTLFIILILPIMADAKGKSPINVAFTIDNNYPIFTLLAINSILLNNYSGSDYHFYIVENNLTDKNKKKMQKYLSKMTEDKNFTAQMEFIDIDTSSVDRGQKFYGYSNVITPIAMARIFLPELLDVDRVLYLDGDILVTTDLSALYNIDLGSYIVGMSPNNSENLEYCYKTKKCYYNSGMILMNLDKCRKTKSVDAMLAFLDKNFDKFVYKKGDDSSTKFLYPDQDLINIVWKGKIKTIDAKWNNQTCRGEAPIAGYKIDGGTVFHFIARIKPWMFEKPYDSATKLYMTYWEESLLCQYIYYYMPYYTFLRCRNIYISEIKRKLGRYALLFGYLFNMEKDAKLNDLFTYQGGI